MITECTYDSTSRDKPILGGYSATQASKIIKMVSIYSRY